MPENSGSVTIKLFAGDTDLGNPGIVSLVICHEVNTISWAELTIDDGEVATKEFPVSNDPNFAPGSELVIELGQGTATEPVFSGIIVRQQIKAGRSGKTRLCLELKHPSVKMTHFRKTRYFPDQTDTTVIETLLGDHEIDNAVDSGMDLEHEFMVQYNVTDWDFMVTRAESNGNMVYTHEQDKVVVAPPKIEVDDDTPKVTFGVDIFEIEAEMESRDQYKGGSAISWNDADQALEDQPANEPEDVSDATSPESADLAESLGQGEFRLRHSGALTDTELVNWSSATLLRSRLSKVRGRIKVLGKLDYLPGTTIEIEGLSDTFNGAAFLAGVRHDVGQGNWTTHLQVGLDRKKHMERHPDVVEAPVSGLLPPIRGLHIGVVKEVADDPEKKFRVQVKLPTVDDEEDGTWCRVSRPDAGAGHGLFFQPKVGDEVVVGFLNEDPRYGIVLGSIHNNGDNEPPISENEEYTISGIQTAEELKMLLNDDEKSITIETPGGKKVVLDDNEGSILMEDENGNSVELNSDGITIKSAGDIVIEATGDVNVTGLNITESASAQYKAEGSAGLEVSSPAITVVKGSLVQIN